MKAGRKPRKNLLMLAIVAAAGSALAQDYDLVILNGRVMDPQHECSNPSELSPNDDA